MALPASRKIVSPSLRHCAADLAFGAVVVDITFLTVLTTFPTTCFTIPAACYAVLQPRLSDGLHGSMTLSNILCNRKCPTSQASSTEPVALPRTRLGQQSKPLLYPLLLGSFSLPCNSAPSSSSGIICGRSEYSKSYHFSLEGTAD